MNLSLLKFIRIALLGLVSICLTLILIPFAIAQHKAMISIPKKISKNSVSMGRSAALKSSAKAPAKRVETAKKTAKSNKNEKLGVVATQTSQQLIAQDTHAHSSEMASPALMTNVTSVTSAKVAERPLFAATLGAEYSRNLVHHNDETDSEDAAYSTTLKYQFHENYRASFFAEVLQDLRKRNETDFGQSSLGFSRSSWGSKYKFTPSLSFGLPLSKEAKDRNSLQTSVTTRGGFGLDLSGTSLSAFKVGAGLSLTRNFHKYDTATTGAVNTQYSSSQEITLGYELSEQWAINTLSRHINIWTYQGNMKDTFLLVQSIDYAPMDALSFSLAHANGGSTLRANGYESNIEVLNKNTSTVSIGAEYAF